MIETVRRLLPGEGQTAAAGPDDERRRLRVATCVLLLEVAHADDTLAETEDATVRDAAAVRFGLGPDEIADLLALADRQRHDASDLYRFARLINEHFTRPQKLAIVELLWRVVYSDGRLEQREDAVMHRVARLLQLRNEELIALKLQVKAGRDGAAP